MQRFMTAPSGGAPTERVLGEIGGALVVAVNGRRGERSIRLGDREIPLADDERVVIRPA